MLILGDRGFSNLFVLGLWTVTYDFLLPSVLLTGIIILSIIILRSVWRLLNLILGSQGTSSIYYISCTLFIKWFVIIVTRKRKQIKICNLAQCLRINFQRCSIHEILLTYYQNPFQSYKILSLWKKTWLSSIVIRNQGIIQPQLNVL